MMYALCALSIFKNDCHGSLTAHLLLDLYHARFSKDLHMSHDLPPESTGKDMVEGLSILV